MGALGQRVPAHIRALDKTLIACNNERRNRSRSAA